MQNDNALPHELAGVCIPDTALVRQAIQLVRAVSSPLLFNHVMRTYLFGALAAKKLRTPYDQEVACLGAVLHDLGLTGYANGPKRFEVEGADAAKRFVLVRGLAEERAELVWDAIALHTSGGIASEKRMEIALTHIGSRMDVLGLGTGAISEWEFAAVLAEYPRFEFKTEFYDSLVQSLAHKPPLTSAFTWATEVARTDVPGYDCPTFKRMMATAAFAS